MMSDSDEEVPRYRDIPEFEEWCDSVSHDLFELNGCLSTMNHFISALETNVAHGKSNIKMSDNINKKTLELIEKSKTLVDSVNKTLHKITDLEEETLDKPDLITREKLTRDAKFSVQEFKKYQQLFLDVTKRINDMAKVALEEDGRAQSSLMDDVLQEEEAQNSRRAQVVIEREPINNEEFAYQQHLIRERDLEITNIQQGITELNSIFKDLGGLVQDQGQLVDNIEANLYNVADNTRSAANELTRSLRSGGGTRKLKLYFLLMLLFFLFLSLLAVFT